MCIRDRPQPGGEQDGLGHAPFAKVQYGEGGKADQDCLPGYAKKGACVVGQGELDNHGGDHADAHLSLIHIYIRGRAAEQTLYHECVPLRQP